MALAEKMRLFPQALNAKWGPALLPVPTSVVSQDPLPVQDAIIGLGARCCHLKGFASCWLRLSGLFSHIPQPVFKISMPNVRFRAYMTSSIEDHPAFVRSFRFQHPPDDRNTRQIIDFSLI